MINDLFKEIMSELPDTIEIDGKTYKLELTPIQMIDNTDIVKEFESKIEKIDSEIWESAVTIFGNKYDVKLFDSLINKERHTEEETEQLKNAIESFEECVTDAATARVKYLIDKYGAKVDC
jgi:hypothetical protein